MAKLAAEAAFPQPVTQLKHPQVVQTAAQNNVITTILFFFCLVVIETAVHLSTMWTDHLEHLSVR